MAVHSQNSDINPLADIDLPSPPLQSEDSAEVATEPFDETHIKRCLGEAEELKQEGNDHFRSKRWDEALAAYRSGLGRIPKRKENKTRRKPTDAQVDDQDDPGTKGASGGSSDIQEVAAEPEPTELEVECAKTRAVINANIGACYVKLGDHKEAAAACTEALRDDPNYVKALQRRASSSEAIDSWSSLTTAQEDYTQLVTLLPPSSPQIVEIKRALQALKPRIEAAQKQETTEMLGKLKGIGDSILGNFGLSTNNFQFIPNGQGGYSMNFTR
ncbi:hypothetical protein EW026_g688 [Hermanssonia centrifuga]|uniref:Uncharacterized protein n=1 Tax=Hermanssonia centrifuga TaxID=98765 RepID=A0A4S4KTW1_9APHY|nr:hypothetical protein EW026_g688 [Hermanssonia centrifuga]